MSNWTLLILDGSTHLVDLKSKFTEVKDFGRFPTQILNDYKINTEFELFDKKAMLVESLQSDLQSNLKRGPQIISPKDIAWIIYKSGVTTGVTIIEAGSGSGALSDSQASVQGDTWCQECLPVLLLDLTVSFEVAANIFSFTTSEVSASDVVRNTEAHHAPDAPIAMAPAICSPVHIPPAASIGTSLIPLVAR